MLLFLCMFQMPVQASSQGIKQVYNNPTSWTNFQQRIRFTLQTSNVSSVNVVDPNQKKTRLTAFLGSYSFLATTNGTYEVLIERNDGVIVKDYIVVQYVDVNKPQIEVRKDDHIISNSKVDGVIHHFYQDEVTLAFTAYDYESGVASLEYQVVPLYGQVQSNAWIKGDEVTLTGKQKVQVYVRAKDNAHNIMSVNSYGIVVYEEIMIENPQAIFDINEFSSEYQDLIFDIDWNDNELYQITAKDEVLRPILDYEIKENQIILKKEYLQHKVRNYTEFTIEFSPLKEKYQAIKGNDEPTNNKIIVYEKLRVEVPRITHDLANDQYLTPESIIEPLEVSANVQEGELTYQWVHNGIPLVEETTNYLELGSLPIGAHEFYVVITNYNEELDQEVSIESNKSMIYINKIDILSYVHDNIKISASKEDLFHSIFTEEEQERLIKGVQLEIVLSEKVRDYSMYSFLPKGTIQSYFELVIQVNIKDESGIKIYEIETLYNPLLLQLESKQKGLSYLYEHRYYEYKDDSWTLYPSYTNEEGVQELMLASLSPILHVRSVQDYVSYIITLLVVVSSGGIVIYAYLKHRKKQ